MHTKLAGTGSRVVSIPLTTGYTTDAYEACRHWFSCSVNSINHRLHYGCTRCCSCNLLSVHKMVKQGDRSVIFDVKGCRLLNREVQVKPECVLATGTQTNGFLTLTDDYTKHSPVYFLQSKSEVTQKFAEYIALVEKQTGHKIKVFLL